MKKTAEAVSLGHPDKTADYISSYILDRMIAQDEQVKYAVEVMVKDNTVVLGGEIKGNVDLSNLEEFVKNALREIGYDELYADRWGNYAIDVRRLNIINLIGKQSSEITQGVATGWGDQGVFVGYACKGDGLISKEQYLARLNYLICSFLLKPTSFKSCRDIAITINNFKILRKEISFCYRKFLIIKI